MKQSRRPASGWQHSSSPVIVSPEEMNKFHLDNVAALSALSRDARAPLASAALNEIATA